MNKKPSQKKRSQLKHLANLSSIGIQMGAIIYLFVLLGKWLDTNYNQGNKQYVIVCTLVGVAFSLYAVIKQLNKIKY